MSNYISEEEFLGKPQSTPQSTSKYVSEEEFLGGAKSTPYEPVTSFANESFDTREEAIRKKVDEQKKQFRQDIERGYATAPIKADESGQLTTEASPAAKEAVNLIMPPFTGFTGGVDALASMASKTPELLGQGVGAITGGVYGALKGEPMKGVQLGAQYGGEAAKAAIPSWSPFTQEGVKKQAQFETILEELMHLGGQGAREMGTGKYPISPLAMQLRTLYQTMPDDLKTHYEATLEGLGQAAPLIAPFLHGLVRPKAPPIEDSIKPAIDKLQQLAQKKELAKPVPYVSEAEFMRDSTSDTPFRQDLGAEVPQDYPIRLPETPLRGEVDPRTGQRIPRNVEEIATTQAERDAMTGRQTLVEPGEEIQPADVVPPKRVSGRQDFGGEPTPYAPQTAAESVIEKPQTPNLGVPERPVTRPGEPLSGQPGAEGPGATGGLDMRLQSFHPLDTFKRIYGEDTHPFTILAGLRGQIGEYTKEIERLQKTRGSADQINELRTQISNIWEKMPVVLDAIRGQNNSGTLRSFNPAQIFEKIDSRSVVAALLHDFGGDKKNAADYADMKAKTAGSEEMKLKYQKASMVLRGQIQESAGQERNIRSFDPLSAMRDMASRSSSLKQFERDLVENYGEDIRTHAKALFTYAKQEKETQKILEGKSAKTETKSSVLPNQEPQDIAQRAVEFGAWDRRSGEEVKASLMDENSPIQDLPDSALTNLGRTLDQGQSYSRNHPILRWVYDRLDWAEREINRTANEIMYGENFVEKNWNPFGAMSSLRRAARDADPDSMMFKYNKLKDSEKLKVNNAANKFNGKTEPSTVELRMEGLSTNEIEAYQNMRKGMDKFWDEQLVPMARKLGIQLPNKLPGYFPMSWFGDYRVWGKHKETGQRWAHGVGSMREAKAAIQELSKKHPEFEFKIEDVTNTHTEFNSTPEAFLDAINLFGRNSEVGKALYEAMTEITMRSGASRHRLARNTEGTLGYAGSTELGKSYAPGRNFGRNKQLIDFERSIETYIETGVRYSKNKETLWDIDKALRDPKFAEKFPNAAGLAENMRGIYLGENKFADAAIDQAMIDLGLSTNFPRQSLSYIAGMVMYAKVMMLRAPFYLAQALQGSFIEPRLMLMKSQGMKGSIIEANAKGMTDWLYGKDRVEDIRWAVKYGVVDPKFAEQLTFIPSIRGKKTNVKDIVNTLTGNRLSAAIDQSTRLQAYLTFLNFAESSGFKGQAAREIAAKHSLDVMVEYESWKRSPLFREIGQLGNAFSPLTTFTNNLLNRITEYSGSVGKGKAAPLASVAALFLFFSGLYGMPFRQDIDDGIDLINKGFDLKWPTVTDFLIKHADKLGSAALFGVPSALMGQQIGGSLGSPQIIGSLIPGLQDPLPKYAYDNASTLALLGKNPTEAEKMKALKAAVPTAPGQGLVENYFSPSNRPRQLSGALPQNKNVVIPQPNMEGGPIRTPAQQTARLFGMRSIPESLDQIKRFRVDAKEQQLQNYRSRAETNVIDSIMAGGKFDRKAVDRYLENGGNPDTLFKDIEKKVENRVLDARSRELGKLKEGNFSDFQRMRLLEEFKLYLHDSNIKKMGTMDNRDNKEISKEAIRKEQTANNVSRDLLIKGAKRMFPNDEKAQENYMRKEIERRIEEKARFRNGYYRPHSPITTRM